MAAQFKTYVRREGGPVEVEAVQVAVAGDLAAVRATEWPEGQLAVLTFPTADPEGYVGVNTPLSAFGTRVVPGQWLVKGPAGDLEVIPDAVFRGEWLEKVA